MTSGECGRRSAEIFHVFRAPPAPVLVNRAAGGGAAGVKLPLRFVIANSARLSTIPPRPMLLIRSPGQEELLTVINAIEIKIFHAIWWTLAMLLPDLLAFATRDWRAAVAGGVASVAMIVLSVRVLTRPRRQQRDEQMWVGGDYYGAAVSTS
jgi:hypothetical protein